ncbi:MAG TPA: radical SAM protein [Vicinamibacterales bacterium]|nr:radical SAM protein [Vicinamibacterales bacterium]
MQPSMFNVRAPIDGSADVFLMNTFTDAQIIVSPDVVDLLDRMADLQRPRTSDEQSALQLLTEHGFVVSSRETERQALEEFFREVREGTDTVKVTVLTTLQCNFACGYCIQGDHGDYNKHAAKMSLDTAVRIAEWTERRLDAARPSRLILTFFGGEPLLNLPVIYLLAERLHAFCSERGIALSISIITNGLLLTREIVERLNPLGLTGIKITLDGDRETHNRMRPLRGGQGTFDRIVANIRQVASLTKIAIGGNFDADSVDSYPALLDFLSEQDFAEKLSRVSFKPVIRETQISGKGIIPLTAIGAEGKPDKPLKGACMTSAGTGVNSTCDSCHVVDEQMALLREETKKHGFSTVDGVHMGPCEIHKSHAHTIGPDGSLYACPGFAGEARQSIGHIDGREEAARTQALRNFERLSAWKACQDCAFIPVCAGGCTVAAHNELGDMHAPNCHKTSFEAGVRALARDAAREYAAMA